jgi:acetyl esterase/lipase
MPQAANFVQNLARSFCVAAAILVIQAGSIAFAQSMPPPKITVSDLPPPDQPGAIALSPAGVTTQGENWNLLGDGNRIVRNVTAPTLTPVLPDPAKATGAAVIVAPGGGFMLLSIDNEGYDVAHWLADHGIAAFVLKYRVHPTPPGAAEFQASMAAFMAGVGKPNGKPPEVSPDALADAQAAVRLVRAHAHEWGIDPTRVGMVGFSAGAMTTLATGIAPDVASRPDFIGVIYGPMNARPVPPDAPPAFFAVALDDPLMARNSNLGIIDSWRSAGRPLEVHLYGAGGHGFGMRSPTAAPALWPDEFYAWMKDRGVLKSVK